MKSLVVDDALKAGTHIGPVVDQSQLDQDYLVVHAMPHPWRSLRLPWEGNRP
jgi:acyl-CoA reductase-like NAD-dependent aldehyde dehydrogenase